MQVTKPRVVVLKAASGTLYVPSDYDKSFDCMRPVSKTNIPEKIGSGYSALITSSCKVTLAAAGDSKMVERFDCAKWGGKNFQCFKPEEAVPDAAVRENEYRIVNGRSRAVKKWSVGPPGSNDCTPGVYTSGCALYDVPGGTWYDPDIYSAEGVPAVAICHEG